MGTGPGLLSDLLIYGEHWTDSEGTRVAPTEARERIGMTLTVERHNNLPSQTRAAIAIHLDRHGDLKDRVYRIDHLGDRWLLHTFAAPLRAAGPGMPALIDAPLLIPPGPRWSP